MSSLITLTTDFGLDDSFVGVMKGVILSINPNARIVDICHNVSSQGIQEGAFVLASAYPYFPPDTIHLAVVDPGVGSGRRPIALATPKGLFVAPDNGLLTCVLADFGVRVEGAGGTVEGRGYRVEGRSLYPLPSTLYPDLKAVHLTELRFWLPKVSATFHGRDIFAPVAAHLSLGVPLGQLGEAIDSLEVSPLSQPNRVAAGMLLAHVVYVDRFGNLTTDARPEDLPPPPLAISIRDRIISGLSASYAEGGALLALINSGDRLEIALRNGSAARTLDAGPGEVVKIERIG
ncbi:MAG: SAM-dependent chlorinase/fluorinase [Chloroflexi bacterium]|nr:SAM-dependent chlorinase/fluorinase [Chloroflexota bacterium]